MSATIVTLNEPSSDGDNKNPARDRFAKKMRTILYALWEVVSNKVLLFLYTAFWVCSVSVFAESKNEVQSDGGCGAITLLLGIAAFILSSFILPALAELAKYLGFKILKNMTNVNDPFDYFKNIRWHQFACICILTLAPVIYLAGSFTGRPENTYSKIINGKPLLDGDSLWIFPLNLANQVTVIEKKQNIRLSGLTAETADGASIIGSLWFDGQLSSASNQWFDFEKKKDKFVAKLKEAYVRAVKATKLADLDKPLVISFETSKESIDSFTDSAILPREGGVIEAYGFKVLAKQSLK